jgi:hypothetical protein
MKVVAIVLGASALAALSACGGPTAYPEIERQAFLSSCTGEGSPKEVCDCALNKFEAKYTFAKFAEWSVAIKDGKDHPVTPEALQLTMECVTEYM